MRAPASRSRTLLSTTTALAVAVATLTLAAAPAAAQTADTAAPVLESVRVEPGAVDVTKSAQTVAVTVHAQDATGVGTATLTLTGPDGSEPITASYSLGAWSGGFLSGDVRHVAGTATDGWWTLGVEVPQTTLPGAWVVGSVSLGDTAEPSNEASWAAAELAALPEPSDVALSVERTPDPDGAAATALSVSSTAVDTTSSGASVEVSVRVVDEVDGFSHGVVHLDHPDGWSFDQHIGDSQRTGGTAFDGTYSVTFDFPQASSPESSTYTPRVVLTDNYGTESSAAFAASAVTVSADEDTSAPVLTGLSVQESVSVHVWSGGEVTWTVSATDDALAGEGSSGFSHAEVLLDDGAGNQAYAYLWPQDGDQVDADTWQVQDHVWGGAVPGSYAVRSATLYDRYGNARHYGPDLEPLPVVAGDNRTLEVTTKAPATATVDALTLGPQVLGTADDPNGDRALYLTTTITTADGEGGQAPGVSYADIEVAGPDGTHLLYAYFDDQTLVSGDDATGTHRTAVYPSGLTPGTYEVTQVVLTTAGDGDRVTVPFGGDTGRSASFAVSTAPDADAPQLGTVDLPDAPVELAPGYVDVPVAVTATDPSTAEAPSSGIREVALTFTGPEGATQELSTSPYDEWSDPPATGDDTDGGWELTGTASGTYGFTPGTWTLTSAVVADRSGRSTTLTGSELEAAVAQRVLAVSPPADDDAPVLTDVALSPDTLVTTGGAAVVTATVTATDATGLAGAQASLMSPDGRQWVYGSSWTWDGDECAHGTCTLQIEVPQYAAPGTWTVEHLSLHDDWGNHVSLMQPELAGLPGLDTSVEVDGLVDPSPPSISDLRFDPAAGVDSSAGERHVLGELRVADAHAGVDWVQVTLSSPDEDDWMYGYGQRVAGDDRDGVYQFELTVPQAVRSGSWAVRAFAEDRYGNETELAGADLTGAGMPGTYAITGLADTTAPVLHDVVLPQGAVDVTGGDEEVPVQVRVTDDLSGFDTASLQLTSESGDVLYGYVSDHDLDDGSSDTYTGWLWVSQYTDSGSYTVTSAAVRDGYGNEELWTAPELVEAGMAEVLQVTAVTDTTPPAVTGFSFGKSSYDLTDGTEQVTGTVDVTDDVSGLSWGSVEVLHPSGQKAWGYLSSSAPVDADTFGFSLEMPLAAAEGTWTVKQVHVHDKRGNARLVAGADLPGSGTRSFTVVNVVVTDGVVSGTVTDADDGGAPLAGAVVTLCDSSSGVCRAPQTTGADGAYSFTDLPNGYYYASAAGPSGETTYASRFGWLDDALFTYADHSASLPIALERVSLPPAGTTVNDSEPGTTPSVRYDQPMVITTTGCTGGTVTYTVTFDGEHQPLTGSLSEAPAGSGTYTATTAAPGHPGRASVAIALACPDPADDEAVAFDIYIDPSGFVYDHDGETTVVGATVTLHRSDTETGAFTVVPDGDVIMSPSNRKNPDLTDSTGHYGWLTIAGYYRVDVTKAGCYQPGSYDAVANTVDPVTESRVVVVPPEVTDLHVTIDCRNLAPVATFTQPTSAVAGAPVEFDGSASSDANGSVASYAWSFGDGATSTEHSPEHTYTTPGVYTPTLTVTDDKGLASVVKTGEPVLVSPPAVTSATYATSVDARGTPELLTGWEVPAGADGVRYCVGGGSRTPAATASSCKDVVAPAASYDRSMTKRLTYTVALYAYKATDAGRAYAPVLAKTLPGTSLVTPSSKTITYGSSVTRSTVLKKGTEPMAGQTVTLHAKKAGSSTWTLVKTVTTSSTGEASVTHKPLVNTLYQWRYQGTADAVLATVSSSYSVKVAYKVTSKATATSVPLGGTASLYGTVAPSASGRSVYLQQCTSSTSCTRTTVKATVKSQRMPDGTTKTGFVLPVTPTAKGTYSYRVEMPASGTNVVGYGPRHSLKVT